MSFSVQPTGAQDQNAVDAFLKAARESTSNANPQVLAINQVQMMQAKRNGYPIHMYHETFEMRMALKVEEEQALAQLGYRREYIRREYPKVLFRRNMSDKFEPEIEGEMLKNNPFVEQVSVKDEKREKELRAMKPKAGQSIWYATLDELPPIEDGPAEDPAITIARLEGERDGLKSKLEDKGKKAA